MSGHSKWNNIKRKKEKTDGAKAKVFTKIGREIAADTAADGWCCVTVDGCPMGGGKVSGGRVKNHYPKALRLL